MPSARGDASPSCAYAEQLTAALALLFLRQRDAVGLVRFDDVVRTEHPAARAHRAVAPHRRRARRAGQRPRLRARRPHCEQAARLVTRRGMVVLISRSAHGHAEASIAALRGLRAAGHDVTVLHIMDPAERDFTARRRGLFIDPETELDVPAAAADVRAAYRDTVEEVIGEWKDALGALGVGLRGDPHRCAVRHSAPAGLRRARASHMSFLAPLWLMLGAAVAVPLLLHLHATQRRHARRVSRRALSRSAPRRSTAARCASEICCS